MSWHHKRNQLLAPVLSSSDSEPRRYQIGPIMSAIFLLGFGIRVWQAISVLPWMSAVSLVLILGGFVVLIGGLWYPRRSRQFMMLAWALAVLGFASWSFLQVYNAPGYGTDEMAFDQFAAHLVLHGVDPYRASLAAAFQRYLVPPIFHTYTLTGGTVTHLSYPDLSFLLYVPVLLAGVHAQAATIVDGLGWIVTSALLWWFLEDEWRWVSILFLGLTLFDNYIIGGVTDSLFLPFLVVAIWRWDRYGSSDGGAARWIGPIAFGLAMAVKQTPWFVAPFLIVGLAKESAQRGRGWLSLPLRYALVAGATFMTVNLPFIAWHPASWVHGVLLPLISPLVPAGQGVVELSYALGIGGGNLHWYTAAGVFALFASLLVTALWYNHVKRYWLMFVPLVFFWVTRSYASYLIDLIPAGVVGYFSVRPGLVVSRTRPRWHWISIGGLGGAFALSLVMALTTHAPLIVRTLSVRSTGQFGTIQEITVQAVNRSAHRIHPHFTVNNAGYVTTFWLTTGPKELKPGSQGVYQLVAPNVDSMPGINGGFQVLAFAVHPDSVSVSPLDKPNRLTSNLEPSAINATIPVGHTIVLKVSLRNRFGQQVPKAHVAISLGQVIYAQNAIVPAEAAINGHAEGETPVMQYTNRSGVAVFRVRDVQPQSEPIYFQAYISPAGRYPYGYSNILTVNFRQKSKS